MREIGIVGAGVSGLLLAHFLTKAGYRVSVFESSSRCGGWLRSEEVDGCVLEWGPNSLLADENWMSLFRDLNLRAIFPADGAHKRFIWKNSRCLSVPMNPISFFSSPLISPSAKLSLVKDLFSTQIPPTKDLTVSDFFRTYFHSDILDFLVEPMVRGVFSGDVDELSMEASFPKLWRGFQEKGSMIRGLFRRGPRRKVLSFPKGLEEISYALSHELGARIFLNHRVSKILGNAGEGFTIETSFGRYCCSEVILTTPSVGAADLLESYLPPSEVEFLRSIPYRRVGVWNTIFQRPESFGASSTGFGCLIPRTEKTDLLGSLWSSEIFQERSRPDRFVASQFFSGDKIPQDPRTSLPLLKKMIGIESEPLYSEMKVYTRAIPQFQLGHSQKVIRLREALPKSIYVAGNYLDGVGLSSVFETSKSLVASLSQ